AIVLMIRALTEAESIDPAKGLKEHYCKLILVSTLLWMHGARADWPMERQAMVIGMCSNPNPLPELRERPLPQPLLAWYELAELEAEISDNKIALAELRKRTKGGKGLLPMETLLAARLLQAATRRLDIDGFLEAMRVYPRAIDLGAKSIKDRKPEDVLNMPIGVIKPVEGKQWQEDRVRDPVRSAILLFVLAAVAQGRHDIYDAFRKSCLQAVGLNAIAAATFDLIDNPPYKGDDAIVSVAKIVHQMLGEDIFDAMDAFGATVVIVQLLFNHVLGETVAGPVVRYFNSVWQEIIVERTFSMRNPSATGPLILAAFDKGVTNTATLAHVALASEAAVKAHFSDDLRTLLHSIAEPTRKPVEYVDFSAKPKT
ncbi:MAG: hypothetical protein K9G30_08890, partial [Parvibaculum sp.]|nr:hypothetical protein [Parvibaculum sp.]